MEEVVTTSGHVSKEHDLENKTLPKNVTFEEHRVGLDNSSNDVNENIHSSQVNDIDFKLKKGMDAMIDNFGVVDIIDNKFLGSNDKHMEDKENNVSELGSSVHVNGASELDLYKVLDINASKQMDQTEDLAVDGIYTSETINVLTDTEPHVLPIDATSSAQSSEDSSKNTLSETISLKQNGEHQNDSTSTENDTDDSALIANKIDDPTVSTNKTDVSTPSANKTDDSTPNENKAGNKTSDSAASKNDTDDATPGENNTDDTTLSENNTDDATRSENNTDDTTLSENNTDDTTLSENNSDDATRSENNTDDTTPSENNTDDATPSENNTDDTTLSENNTDDATPSKSNTDDTTLSENNTDDATPSENNTDDTTLSENNTDDTTLSENITDDSTPIVDNTDDDLAPLDEWLDILGNGMLKKKIIKRGNGRSSRPIAGDIVKIRYEGKLDDDTVVDSNSNLEFILSDEDVIQAFDLAVALMEDKEIAILYTDARYAYGIYGRTDYTPPIPQNAAITYELEILSVKNGTATAELTDQQRILYGDKKRIHGNDLYSRGDFSGSINAYKRGLKYLESSDDKEVIIMKVKCLNNLSAAQLKVKAYSMAIQSLNTVLFYEAENVKALFRKGKCYDGMGKTEEALNSMKKASMLDPLNKMILQELGRLRSRVAVTHQKEKEMYQRMFQQNKTKNNEEDDIDTETSSWRIIIGSVVIAGVGILAGLAYFKHR